jgi:hypothetical protein
MVAMVATIIRLDTTRFFARQCGLSAVRTDTATVQDVSCSTVCDVRMVADGRTAYGTLVKRPLATLLPLQVFDRCSRMAAKLTVLLRNQVLCRWMTSDVFAKL